MKRHTLALALGSLLGFTGCYSSAFVRNDGPVRGNGVVVSLVGQRCDFEPDMSSGDETTGYANRLDLGIKLAVENDTPETITVRPENFRLILGDATDPPAVTVQPLNVAPGATTKLNLSFQHRGDFGCNANLSLGFANVIVAGAHPVELKPLAFVATTSET
jgi:hypothetical protein